jgi:hypothetical protein
MWRRYLSGSWPIIAIGVAAVVVVIVIIFGAVSLLSRQTAVWNKRLTDPAPPLAVPNQVDAPKAPMKPDTPSDTAPVPPAEPAVPPQPIDVGWIEKAMAECEADAHKQPDRIFFLLIPLVAPEERMGDWRTVAAGELGGGVPLIASKDALGGLKAGTIALSNAEYQFAILDEATKKPINWTPAKGVVKLVTPPAKDIKSFRPGMLVRDFTKEPRWGNPFSRQPGSCYWASVIIGN